MGAGSSPRSQLYLKGERLVFPEIGFLDLDDVLSGEEILDHVIQVIKALAVAAGSGLPLTDGDCLPLDLDAGGDFLRAAIETGIDVLQFQFLTVIAVFDAVLVLGVNTPQRAARRPVFASPILQQPPDGPGSVFLDPFAAGHE